MVEFLRRLGRFLTTMDAKAITSLAVSLVLLGLVICMLAFGQQWLNLEQDGQLGKLLMRAAESRWAVVGVISIFMVLALTGFPQIWLITATVIVFGPRDGAIYSWIATMASATLTFGLGHFLGGRWLRRYGGEKVQKTIEFIGRHGVMASGLVRVVPSAPSSSSTPPPGRPTSHLEILARHRRRHHPENPPDFRPYSACPGRERAAGRNRRRGGVLHQPRSEPSRASRGDHRRLAGLPHAGALAHLRMRRRTRFHEERTRRCGDLVKA
ncbi:MAG: VTT domain-containing protein [Parvularculaceae bacterium]